MGSGHPIRRVAGAAALAVRGGGFLGKTAPRTIFSGVLGLYGAQMLLAPRFCWEQNFKMVPDKYHNFMARICGCFVFGSVRALNKLSPEESFGVTLPVSILVAVLGPVNAEMNLDTNTAHGAVYVLFPLLLMAHVLAL